MCIQVEGILYSDKHPISEQVLRELFSILKENYQFLYHITEEDFLLWSQNIRKTKEIHTYVLKEQNHPIGYTQYLVQGKEICLSEIQIDRTHQGDRKTFRKLMRDFIVLSELKEDDVVFLHIHPQNKKSQEVFMGLGFQRVEHRRYEITGKKIIEKFLNEE